MLPDGSMVTGSSGGLAAVWNSQGQVTSKGSGTIWDLDETGTVFVGETVGRPAIWLNNGIAQPILATEESGVSFSVRKNGEVSVGYVAPENFVSTAATMNHQTHQREILYPNNTPSTIHRITPDGKTIVGTQSPQYLSIKAFRKVENDEIEDLGYLTGDLYNYAEAFDVSDDGEIVVGISALQVFRWTSKGEMVGLGYQYPSYGQGPDRGVSVSGDGRVIVGGGPYKDENFSTGAFIWDEKNGLRNLKVVIESAGVDLSDWTLELAQAISFDGDVIAGRGIRNVSGFEVNQTWMVRGYSKLLPPTISLEAMPGFYLVRFTGVLQESDDLGITDPWSDVAGNPTAKFFIFPPYSSRQFFRARSF